MSPHRYVPTGTMRAARAEPVAARRALIAEAFHTFGEPSARRLAKSLAVDFDTCRADIARLDRQPGRI